MQNDNQLVELGKYYLSINQIDLAWNILKEVAASSPNNSLAYELLAQIAFLKGDEMMAYKLLSQACNTEGCSSEALYCLGQNYLASKKFSDAIEIFERSIAKNGEYFEVLHDLGTCYANQGILIKAIEFYNKALEIKNDVPELFFNLGRMEDELKNYSEAINHYGKAISLKADYAEAWSHKGLAFHELERYEEALSAFDAALNLTPNYSEALNFKAVTLSEMRRYTEALTCLDKAIIANPSFSDALWNKATTQLVLGNFEEGWKNYEFRWAKSKSQPYKYPEIPQLPTNETQRGRRILVWAEQGYGDTLQFSRYIHLLLEQGAQVIFEVQKPLLNLLRNNIQCQVVEKYDPTIEVDYQVPLLTLPHIFKTTLDSIPPIYPNINLTGGHLGRLGKFLLSTNNKINIGISCSGNPEHLNDRNRSMPLINFLPLLDISNLYLIQKGVSNDDLKCLDTHTEIKYLGNELIDFEDSAAIINSMDLIISVDTSLAHLAGILKKKLFLLLPFSPEWRWMSEGSTSPWYPSTKIFRQNKRGDWGTVIDQIMAELITQNQCE
ncbi:tetratricopeptide repeat protein [Polynucleobacter sp. es-EL-1]|uniref:tetratricopeptide repeat protein n=1 Tax=Polynucleobacter sp. es-EL-1 TaxID=1855652 RepID=UPI001BFDDBCA|nr:tetratricopeptide repeat protein [Polynucleobacter sp. es-EL-1]QWE10987.1 tetratricopeptide repeat protein [Polynucleobacter sp. es-EL-1]